MIFKILWWTLGGKAQLKREVFARTALTLELLPFDSRVIELLRSTPQRPRVLCTATDIKPARLIADHLGLFEETLATQGRQNLAGKRKAEALVARFGDRGFDYVGNAQVDLHVWRRARRAWVVNAGAGLARGAARVCDVVAHWPVERGAWRAWLKALRPHQWLKNLLVFVPVLASHRFLDQALATNATLAFIAFSLCASGVYLVNDILDLESDRSHPRKRFRPLAAGSLPVAHGVIAAPALTMLGIALAWIASPATALALVVYFALTLAYSLRLKRIVLVDVIALAGLYTARIITGTIATGLDISFWLLAFSMFLFLSLAMLKRFTELRVMLIEGRTDAAGRGYFVTDLSVVQSLGGASGFIAVLVLCLYIQSQSNLLMYGRPEILWLLCPLLLYWISRVWLVASRGEMHDDPIVFAAKDIPSQLVLALFLTVSLAAL